MAAKDALRAARGLWYQLLQITDEHLMGRANNNTFELQLLDTHGLLVVPRYRIPCRHFLTLFSALYYYTIVFLILLEMPSGKHLTPEQTSIGLIYTEVLRKHRVIFFVACRLVIDLLWLQFHYCGRISRQ